MRSPKRLTIMYAFWGWPTSDLEEPDERHRLRTIYLDGPAADLGLWVHSEDAGSRRITVQLRGPDGRPRIIGGGSAGILALRVPAGLAQFPGTYRAIVLDSDTEEVLAEAVLEVAVRT